jgi:hypothetical protein
MVWEAVFFLVLLKIPVVYLGLVVWWAVRGELDRGEPTEVATVPDTPPSGPGYGRRSRPPRHPVGSGRRPPRHARVRMRPRRLAEARR